jgi:hypothetical protein
LLNDGCNRIVVVVVVVAVANVLDHEENREEEWEASPLDAS